MHTTNTPFVLIDDGVWCLNERLARYMRLFYSSHIEWIEVVSYTNTETNSPFVNYLKLYLLHKNVIFIFYAFVKCHLRTKSIEKIIPEAFKKDKNSYSYKEGLYI